VAFCDTVKVSGLGQRKLVQYQNINFRFKFFCNRCNEMLLHYWRNLSDL